MSLSSVNSFLNNEEYIQVRLDEELLLLKNLFFERLNKYEIPLNKNKDSTFNLDNWLVTFPYNYYYYSPSKINRIRKLALINVMYLFYGMAEDNILDEYHLLPDEYKKIIVKFIESHFLKNEALTGLVNLFGSSILTFYKKYEKAYYQSLKWEKQASEINVETMLNEENLYYMGIKLLPLNLTFAGFCTITNNYHSIPKSEKLLVQYHIGKQLCDDLIDLNKDIIKPDKSFLLKSCINSLQTQNPTIEDVNKILYQDWFRKKLSFSILLHLNRSLKLSEELNFQIFSSHIKQMLTNINKSKYFN